LNGKFHNERVLGCQGGNFTAKLFITGESDYERGIIKIMSNSMDAAKVQLESHGLHVTLRYPGTLFVAATLVDSSSGISVSPDAAFLMDQGEKWRAIFPARGQCTFEVTGTPKEVVDLLLAVYRDYQIKGGRLYEAFVRIMPSSQDFLIGAATDSCARN
jgi:hypothetical protein